jgi:hypothetical protein
MLDKDQSTRITTLSELNDAMRKLTPEITGISVDMLERKGANRYFLNMAIANSYSSLYDGITRADILEALRPELEAVIDTQPTTFSWDSHGAKHFPGGPDGTKFTSSKEDVNPVVEPIIAAEIGRIRRNANGANANYYLTHGGIGYNPSDYPDTTIQVDFIFSEDDQDRVEYHAYPDNVNNYSLSRDKGGADI